MSKIMPEMYKGVIEQCNDLIEEANMLCFNKDDQGMLNAIVYLDDVEKMIQQLARKAGEITILRDGLSHNSPARKKYNAAFLSINEMITSLSRIK